MSLVVEILKMVEIRLTNWIHFKMMLNWHLCWIAKNHLRDQTSACV